MTEDAQHSHSEIREESGEVITKMQIALSAELYARALLICQRRNCTLETVVEDLIERFLPAASPDERMAIGQVSIAALFTNSDKKSDARNKWARKFNRKR